MIILYGAQGRIDLDLGRSDHTALPEGTLWIDLFEETEAETALVERLAGVRLPSLLRIAEIETSSRQSVEGDSLQMSTPVLFRDDDHVETTSVGFVLTPQVLISLRSKQLKAFSELASRLRGDTAERMGQGADVLLALLDAIVDRMADGMEAVGADLDRVSRHIFKRRDKPERSRADTIEADLRHTLRTIGRSGDVASQARDSLLGLDRLAVFLAANTGKQLSPEAARQLKTLRQDIASLNDYETHLTNKVQFLLDSTLGFITIEQNRIFKLLTIISIIGIPPTFVVGLYGMNFKNMPEYDWTYGYQWGLGMVLLSIIVPAVWLKLKGWF